MNYCNMAAGIHSINYCSVGSTPVPTTNQLVGADYPGTAVGCCLERCLHRTKRTVAVNKERNTPVYNIPDDDAVWGAVKVTTRGRAAKKMESN